MKLENCNDNSSSTLFENSDSQGAESVDGQTEYRQHSQNHNNNLTVSYVRRYTTFI